jgi:hypothetical protein
MLDADVITRGEKRTLDLRRHARRMREGVLGRTRAARFAGRDLWWIFLP